MKCVEQYNCHNYQRCDVPRNESIARAVRQVQFVVKAGFPGALWCECPPRHSGKLGQDSQGMVGCEQVHRQRGRRAAGKSLRFFDTF